jgi:hypothetical protein
LYRCRWEIETFVKVLKNGCRVEALQLASVAKIERALAVYMVVAWRLAHLVRLGRAHPDLEATALHTADEWKGAYILAKKPIPVAPHDPRGDPANRHAWRISRPQARRRTRREDLWRGLQRVRGFIEGVEHMRAGHAI